MVCVIRQARQKDFKSLIEIWQKAGFYYPSWDRRENLLNKINLQPALFLVAEVNGVVIGGVIGTYDGWAAYVNHLAIDPRYRHQKWDKLLLVEIERRFRKLGVETVFVFTFPKHSENKRYQEAGYKKWGTSLGWEKRL